MTFLRKQLSPYCTTTLVQIKDYDGRRFDVQRTEPAMKFAAPLPQGKSGCAGEPSDHRPDVYGYTDFDDYHLCMFGA